MKCIDFVKETETKYFLADSIKVIEGLGDTKTQKNCQINILYIVQMLAFNTFKK
jgi:hypothetical protein